MELDFTQLEAKVAQAAALCEELRQANVALRAELAAANDDRERLAGKLDAARERLLALVEHLPET
jgi:chromosome segregation ATPase